MSDWRRDFLRLSPRAFLKRLEAPSVYLAESDDLFEVNEEAYAFFMACDGTHRGQTITNDDEFVAYSLSEGILTAETTPSPRSVTSFISPIPSLRTLELQLTSRCNLKCLHCYQGAPTPIDLPLDAALSVTRQFEAMGGLKLLISGGEPMLYTSLSEFIQKTADLSIRRVLITNGSLITDDNVRELKIDEIQFSLDGWKAGHEFIRGQGSFDAVMRAIRAARGAGRTISIATMIHQKNLDEFDRLASFIDEIDAVAWGIDVPCACGRLTENRNSIVSPGEAAPFLKYAFGGSVHTADGFACGHHLMTVLPTGIGVKCGFYTENSLGNAMDSLAGCWERLEHIPIEALECRGCPHLVECRGGCRFRASGSLKPDPVMCAVYGVTCR